MFETNREEEKESEKDSNYITFWSSRKWHFLGLTVILLILPIQTKFEACFVIWFLALWDKLILDRYLKRRK